MRNRRLFARMVSRWRRGACWVASFRKTIRGRILVAFLVMSMITAALGYYAILGIKDAGVLVDKTYDQSLMSINYARAAAADFAAMRAAFARRWIADDPDKRASLDEQSTVSPRRSATTSRSRCNVRNRTAPSAPPPMCSRRQTPGRALASICWTNQARRQLGPARPLCQEGRRANRSADQLYRRRRIHLSAIGAQCGRARYESQYWRHGSGSAAVGPGRVGLARRIIRPVAAASNVAEHIAGGKLDVVIPSRLRRRARQVARFDEDHARQHQGDDGARGGAAALRAGAAGRRIGKLAGRRAGRRRRRLHRARQCAGGKLAGRAAGTDAAGHAAFHAAADVDDSTMRAEYSRGAITVCRRPAKSRSPKGGGCASARARHATAALSSFAATSVIRRSRRPVFARSMCVSMPRSTTCRKDSVCSTPKIASKWSIADSSKFSACRANRLSRALLRQNSRIEQGALETRTCADGNAIAGGASRIHEPP